METKDPTKITVFLSVDGTLADGSPVSGPWQGVDVELTAEEISVVAAITDRAKAVLVGGVNAAIAKRSNVV